MGLMNCLFGGGKSTSKQSQQTSGTNVSMPTYDPRFQPMLQMLLNSTGSQFNRGSSPPAGFQTNAIEAINQAGQGAQTSLDAPLVTTAISVFNKWGHVPKVAPRSAGSAPYYVFTDWLKLPNVSVGLGHGSGAHAPNEYMVIEPTPGSGVAGLAAVEKFYVDVLFAMADATVESNDGR